MTRSAASYPPRPADEPRRLETLHSYRVLDTPSEPAFDELVALAARLTGAPMALITLVDEDRQWFKARLGLDLAQTVRDDSFCAHALGQSDLLVVEDARRDERFQENPLVIGDPNIRFYAGAPLVASNGQGLGALCVLDREPRHLTDDQALTLRVLSRQVMTQLELRRLLQRSQEQRQELIALLEALPAAVIIVDAPDGQMSYHNRAAATLLDLPSNTPAALRDFWKATGVRDRHGVTLPPPAWPGVRALAGEVVPGVDLTLTLPDGRSLAILVAAAPIRESSGEITSAVIGFQDVSQMHELARLKNEFVATVSHELRTLLTTIKGSLQLLLGDPEALPTSDGQALVQVGLKNVERLVRIINDILDIAKIEAGELPMVLKPVDLSSVVAASIEAVQGLAHERAIQLSTRPPSSPVTVLADADRLIQSLVNLLSNAIKFSPAKGRVEVRVDRTAEGCILAVSDQGRGIPPTELGRVFDKFHQVGGANRQGTGLGLSITRAIVEQHGGHIRVDSEVGSGSTFTIVLPAMDAPSR